MLETGKIACTLSRFTLKDRKCSGNCNNSSGCIEFWIFPENIVNETLENLGRNLLCAHFDAGSLEVEFFGGADDAFHLGLKILDASVGCVGVEHVVGPLTDDRILG